MLYNSLGLLSQIHFPVYDPSYEHNPVVSECEDSLTLSSVATGTILRGAKNLSALHSNLPRPVPVVGDDGPLRLLLEALQAAGEDVG